MVFPRDVDTSLRCVGEECWQPACLFPHDVEEEDRLHRYCDDESTAQSQYRDEDETLGWRDEPKDRRWPKEEQAKHEHAEADCLLHRRAEVEMKPRAEEDATQEAADGEARHHAAHL